MGPPNRPRVAGPSASIFAEEPVQPNQTRLPQYARRLFEQRAAPVDGAPVEPQTEPVRGMVVQVGKRRWLRLV